VYTPEVRSARSARDEGRPAMTEVSTVRRYGDWRDHKPTSDRSQPKHRRRCHILGAHGPRGRTRQGGRHEHACPAIVGSGPVYPPHLRYGAVRSAARAAVAPLGIFHAEWRIDRASAAVDAGAAVHRCAGSLAVSTRGRQHPRPPAYRAGLSLVERRHPDAVGSAVDDHRTPLLAEHQADRLHRVHVRLVPGPGALPGARGPALAGTQSHDARPGRHRPLATPDLLVAGSACRRRSSHAMRRSPNRTSFLRPLPLTRGGLFLFRFLFARGRLSKSGRVALPLKERSGLTVMPPPIRSRTCATEPCASLWGRTVHLLPRIGQAARTARNPSNLAIHSWSVWVASRIACLAKA